MRFALLFLMSIVLFSSGCIKVGPDFVPPEALVADSWLPSEDEKLSPQPDTFQTWWMVFNDPTLNSLVDEARKQNLGLEIAGLRVLEARAQLGIATGTLYPQVQQANAAAAAVGASRHAANTASGDLHYRDAVASFDAAWELDFWGKFRRGVEAADARFLAAIADYDDVTVSLTAEVARTYILIRTLEERIRLAEESAVIQERSLEIAENRFDGGLVTELDFQQARSLLANTRAAIPGFRVDYQRARNALNVLLGLPPGSLKERLESDPNLGIPLPPVRAAVGVPADLLRRRPDIRSAELQTAAQSALIGVAKADLFPHFTLIGSIGLQASDSSLTRKGGSDLSDLFSGDSLSYFAGPSLTWDLFNYGRIKNQVRVQDARLQQLIVNYRDTVLRAAQEVEDAMVGFLENQIQARYLADAVEASRRSVDISTLQYSEGLTDYQRVLDAQRSLTQDQDSLAAIRGSVVLNLVNMYKALGGGWQLDEKKDVVSEENRSQMRERTSWGGLLETRRPDISTDSVDWRLPDW
jgi:NodT family efflux transporter outer membrane factor (OMF) lipoprotein